MSESGPLTPREQENLVAYLDGELTEDESRAVEADLSQRAEVRREADALRHTWELLEYLPRPQASQDFTHRTLERLDTLQLRQQARARRRRWLARAGWAAGLVAAGVLSFMAISQWWAEPAPVVPVPPAELSADDLRLLEHWREYEKIDNVTFLQGLEPIFGEDS
jgi:anti-sigma factor RsiW